MKFKVDHVKFVVHRLGLAVVNLHSKFGSVYVYLQRRYERQRRNM